MAEPRDGEPREPGLSASHTVLVVVRDSATGGRIVGALQRRGFPALQGSTPAQALHWARREPPALVILDARQEGWRRLAGELRQDGRTVLVLTGDPDARVAALETGCLDEGLSELDPEALALRAGVLLGRTWGSDGPRVAAGPLVVDLSAGCLIWRGRRIQTPRLLLRLAAYLAAHAGEVVPTEVLLEEVWAQPWANPNKVHQAILRLRRLLGEPAASSFLVGRQRHGYVILPDATPIRTRRVSRA